MTYFSLLYKEKNHRFLLQQIQYVNGISLIFKRIFVLSYKNKQKTPK